MKRRRFLQLSSIAGLGISMGLYSWQIEPFWLEFVYHKIVIPNLPSELKGKTMMQISDLHMGDRFPIEHIQKSLAKARTKDPDFVVYTGDYITYDSSVQLSQLKNNTRYFVKGKIGTTAVLGNHDYGKNWSNPRVADQITEELTNAGIQVLRNEKSNLNGLTFIGLDDIWGTNFNPQFLNKSLAVEDATIVLSHNPDTADLDIWGDYNSWIFSGHTHGGQCKPPFLPPPMLPVKNPNYTSGIFHLSNKRRMYINRALGHLWQFRFNVRPEITIFVLS